jgi:hypothetical protein
MDVHAHTQSSANTGHQVAMAPCMFCSFSVFTYSNFQNLWFVVSDSDIPIAVTASGKTGTLYVQTTSLFVRRAQNAVIGISSDFKLNTAILHVHYRSSS